MLTSPWTITHTQLKHQRCQAWKNVKLACPTKTNHKMKEIVLITLIKKLWSLLSAWRQEWCIMGQQLRSIQTNGIQFCTRWRLVLMIMTMQQDRPTTPTTIACIAWCAWSPSLNMTMRKTTSWHLVVVCNAPPAPKVSNRLIACSAHVGAWVVIPLRNLIWWSLAWFRSVHDSIPGLISNGNSSSLT